MLIYANEPSPSPAPRLLTHHRDAASGGAERPGAYWSAGDGSDARGAQHGGRFEFVRRQVGGPGCDVTGR